MPTKTTPPPQCRPARPPDAGARSSRSRPSSAVSTRSWPADRAAAERRRPTAIRPRAPPGGGPAPLRHRQRAAGPAGFARRSSRRQGGRRQPDRVPATPCRGDGLVILRSTGPRRDPAGHGVFERRRDASSTPGRSPRSRSRPSRLQRRDDLIGLGPNLAGCPSGSAAAPAGVALGHHRSHARRSAGGRSSHPGEH